MPGLTGPTTGRRYAGHFGCGWKPRYGLLVKLFAPDYMARVSEKVANLQNLTWGNFFVNNLIPVTIGNIIGGAVLVAAIYWSIFLRNKEA